VTSDGCGRRRRGDVVCDVASAPAAAAGECVRGRSLSTGRRDDDVWRCMRAMRHDVAHRSASHLHRPRRRQYISIAATCVDTVGTVPVLWAGHFQCYNINMSNKIYGSSFVKQHSETVMV